MANVTGEVRRGESGPTALHTRMGWVLSGPIESSMRESFLISIS